MLHIIFWLIFLISFILTLVVLLIVHNTKMENIRNTQENINTKAFDLLEEKGFNISKIIYLIDNATYDYTKECKKFIAVDIDKKEICLIDYEHSKVNIVKFNEILNYEIYENGGTITEGGNLGVFHNTGVFTASTNGTCKTLKLIIRLKRYDISQITYDIISNTLFNTGINKSDKTYESYIEKLQKVTSLLEVIMDENKNNTQEKS